MKKNVLLYIVLFFTISTSWSQGWVWKNHNKTIGDETTSAITVDSEGNIYSTFSFDGETKIGDAAAYVSTGIESIAFYKTDSSGNLLWVRYLDTGEQVYKPTDVVYDEANDEIIINCLTNNSNFLSISDNDTIRFSSVSCYNSSVRFSKEGEYVSHISFERFSLSGDNELFTYFDTDGNTFIITRFMDSILILEQNIKVISEYENRTSCIWKFNQNGDLVDFIQPPLYRLFSVNLTIDNHLIISGSFKDSLEFAGQTMYIQENPIEPYNNTILEYSNTLDEIWSAPFYEEEEEYLNVRAFRGVAPKDIIKDKEGNYYIYSTFNKGFKYNNSLYVAEKDIADGKRKSNFIAKMNPAHEIEWIQMIQSQTDFNNQGTLANKMILTEDGFIYVAGEMAENTVFNNDTVFGGERQSFYSFIAKYDTTGEFHFFDGWGNFQQNPITDIGLMPSGDVLIHAYVTGSSTGVTVPVIWYNALYSSDFLLRDGIQGYGGEFDLDAYSAMYHMPNAYVEVDDDKVWAREEALTYQWTKDGDTIPGATNREYFYTTDSDYRVLVSYGIKRRAKSLPVRPSLVTGIIKDHTLSDLFMIYPNPVNSTFNVVVPEGIDIYNWSISDVSGHLLERGNELEALESIDLINYELGLYFITLESNNGIVTTKLIKE